MYRSVDWSLTLQFAFSPSQFWPVAYATFAAINIGLSTAPLVSWGLWRSTGLVGDALVVALAGLLGLAINSHVRAKRMTSFVSRPHLQGLRPKREESISARVATCRVRDLLHAGGGQSLRDEVLEAATGRPPRASVEMMNALAMCCGSGRQEDLLYLLSSEEIDLVQMLALGSTRAGDKSRAQTLSSLFEACVQGRLAVGGAIRRRALPRA